MARGEKFGERLYWLLRKIAEDPRYAEHDSGSQAAILSLVIRAGNPRGEFRVKYSTLAEWLGVHPASVGRYLRPLVASGLLEKSRQLRVAANGSRVETVPRYRVDPELVAKVRVSDSNPATAYELDGSRHSNPATPVSGSNPATPASDSNPATAGPVYRSDLRGEVETGLAAGLPTAPLEAPPPASLEAARDRRKPKTGDGERGTCSGCGDFARLWAVGRDASGELRRLCEECHERAAAEAARIRAERLEAATSDGTKTEHAGNGSADGSASLSAEEFEF